jgi:hypothetical protein
MVKVTYTLLGRGTLQRRLRITAKNFHCTMLELRAYLCGCLYDQGMCEGTKEMILGSEWRVSSS